MTEQYIVRRTRKGRFSDKGYMFDDSKWIATIEKRITRSIRLTAAISFILGLLLGIVL